MKLPLSRLVPIVLVFCGVAAALFTGPVYSKLAGRSGQVVVSGKRLVRDGQPWIPHGFYQIAFEVAPGNLGRADHPFWATAYNNYSPEEYAKMRKSGADSVRLQVAQAGADPQSKLFDREFLDKTIGAIRAARAAGLTVIVCVQDESHVPGEKSIDLPDDGTRRVWKEIAPQFANDRDVLFELLNEPSPAPNPQNWKRWKAAMTETIRTVRETGARNV
ncbi:cellulase family glycosylhydrolase [Nostoc sp.]